MQRDPLAPELVAIIFDHLSESLVDISRFIPGETIYTPREIELKKCLVSCSLVCRQWRALAEPYLNHTLAIRFTYLASPGERTLDDVAIWLDENPSLLTSVRYLRLVMYREFNWSRGNIAGDMGMGCDPFQLLNLLQSFQHLVAIALVGIRFPWKDVADALPSASPVIPLLKPLRQFVILHPQPFPPAAQDAIIMLSWLGDVEEVTIETHPWLHWRERTEFEDGVDNAPIPMNTRSLKLSLSGSEFPSSVVETIMRSSTFQTGTLTRLDLAVDAGMLSQLSTLFTPVASSLRELRLDFVPILDLELGILPSSYAIASLISLSRLARLQHLHLEIPLPNQTPHRIYWDIHHTIQQQLPSLTSLASLSLFITDTTVFSALDEETRVTFLTPLLVSIALTLGSMSTSTFKYLDIVLIGRTGERRSAPEAFRDEMRSLLGDHVFERGIVRI